MTTTDERRQYSAAVHNKLRAIFEAAEQQAHDAIQADDNAQARVADLEVTIERLRKEREIATCESEQRRLYIEQLESELSDLRAANHAYAQTLTAIREALGGEDDADLVEEARYVRAAVFSANEQANALARENNRLEREIERLQAESEGCRQMVLQAANDRRAEWTRAERAESDLDWVMGLVHAYKAAVDAQSDVADAQAALFRVLVEMEQC